MKIGSISQMSLFDLFMNIERSSLPLPMAFRIGRSTSRVISREFRSSKENTSGQYLSIPTQFRRLLAGNWTLPESIVRTTDDDVTVFLCRRNLFQLVYNRVRTYTSIRGPYRVPPRSTFFYDNCRTP